MCWGHLRNVHVGEMLAVSLAVKLHVNKSSPDTFPPELQLWTPGLLQDWAFTILILSWILFLGSVDFFYFLFFKSDFFSTEKWKKTKRQLLGCVACCSHWVEARCSCLAAKVGIMFGVLRWFRDCRHQGHSGKQNPQKLTIFQAENFQFSWSQWTSSTEAFTPQKLKHR